MNIVKTVIKYIFNQSAKQYRCYITVLLGRNSNTHHVDEIYIHLFKLLIDRIDIHINTFYIEFNSFTRQVRELAECYRWSTCNLVAVPSLGFESYRGQDFL